MKNQNASNKGKFSAALPDIVAQKSPKVLQNGRLKKFSTKPGKATQPNNFSFPKLQIAACVVSLLGLGALVLGGFSVWLISRNNCNGTFNLKANTRQGLEMMYTKNNCSTAQSQQALK